MSNVLIFNKTNGNVIAYLQSVNTPDYDRRDDVLVNPDLSGVKIPLEYLKISGTNVLEMTVAEKAVIDAAKPAPTPSIESRLTALEVRVAKLEKP